MRLLFQLLKHRFLLPLRPAISVGMDYFPSAQTAGRELKQVKHGLLNKIRAF